MDKLAETLDELFDSLKVFVNTLNTLVKEMNHLRQLCDVISKECGGAGDKNAPNP